MAQVILDLDLYRDGVSGRKLCVHHGFEWAAVPVRALGGKIAWEIMRRPESHVGSYGGWRWEVSLWQLMAPERRSLEMYAPVAAEIEKLMAEDLAEVRA